MALANIDYEKNTITIPLREHNDYIKTIVALRANVAELSFEHSEQVIEKIKVGRDLHYCDKDFTELNKQLSDTHTALEFEKKAHALTIMANEKLQKDLLSLQYDFTKLSAKFKQLKDSKKTKK